MPLWIVIFGSGMIIPVFVPPEFTIDQVSIKDQELERLPVFEDPEEVCHELIISPEPEIIQDPV